MKRLVNLVRRLAWGSIGALVFYLVDPDRGRARRARLRDQALARLRRAGNHGNREVGAVGRRARDRIQQALHHSGPPADDKALDDRIRSEVLGHHDSSQVVIETTGGTVTLRGEMASRARMDSLVEGVRRIPGVAAVVDLMHLPGADAPNKEASLRATADAAS